MPRRECFRQALILRQRIVELRRDAQQSLWRCGPWNHWHLDLPLRKKEFLQGVEIERCFRRLGGLTIRHWDGRNRTDHLVRTGRRKLQRFTKHSPRCEGKVSVPP